LVTTRWQQYSTHLHTNSTQNTENGTYIITRGNNNNYKENIVKEKKNYKEKTGKHEKFGSKEKIGK
jgi:hypothetical protein